MGRFMQTVAAMACIKTLLMIFNLAYWASGLGIFCAGIWMQVELHKYLELNADFSKSAPYILVGTGAIILIVSTLACFCTVKGQPSLLYTYGGFLGCILIIELAVAASIYAYRDRLADGFDRGLTESMKQYESYENKKTTDFDIMQATLKCCGNHGYDDWNNPPVSMPVPKSCCRIPNCNTQDESKIFTEGCFESVVEFINDNMAVIGGASLAVAFFSIIGIILAFCLAANINKAKYEQMT